MTRRTLAAFDPATFLSKAGLGRRFVQLKIKEPFFSQGDKSDCVFYLQKGRAKLTVISAGGKEATIALLGPGDFLGEESVAAVEEQFKRSSSGQRYTGRVEITFGVLG